MHRKRFSRYAVCRKNWHWQPERVISDFLFLESYRKTVVFFDAKQSPNSLKLQTLISEVEKRGGKVIFTRDPALHQLQDQSSQQRQENYQARQQRHQQRQKW